MTTHMRQTGSDIFASGAKEPRCPRRSWRRALPQPDIGSHANAVGGKCLRQHEGRARGARSKRPRIRVDEPKRSTLQALLGTILEIVPDAEQVISYRVPAFRVAGTTVAGFAAFRDHMSYLPFSGSVLPQLSDQLNGCTMTKSALHFPVDRPLP